MHGRDRRPSQNPSACIVANRTDAFSGEAQTTEGKTRNKGEKRSIFTGPDRRLGSEYGRTMPGQLQSSNNYLLVATYSEELRSILSFGDRLPHNFTPPRTTTKASIQLSVQHVDSTCIVHLEPDHLHGTQNSRSGYRSCNAAGTKPRRRSRSCRWTNSSGPNTSSLVMPPKLPQPSRQLPRMPTRTFDEPRDDQECIRVQLVLRNIAVAILRSPLQDKTNRAVFNYSSQAKTDPNFEPPSCRRASLPLHHSPIRHVYTIRSA